MMLLAPALLFLISAYICDGKFYNLRSTALPHSAVVDSDGKYHIFWNFDDEKIVFEVQVQTLGYVGFGLSPNGDMPGSDIVIAGVGDADGEVYFSDRHAEGRMEPVRDQTEDWVVLMGMQNDTFTTLRFWRKLDTCDENDRPIKPETVRIIWAYHERDWDSLQGRYHRVKRGSKSIYLLNPQKTVPIISEDIYTLEFLNTNVKVPDDDTVYWCEAFSLHQLQQRHHVVKFEPVIQKGNEGLVHHIVMYACAAGTTNETAGQRGPCFDGFMPEAWNGCTTTIFAWAVGGGPFYLPEHVGYPFGFEDDPKLILLQTHYDNPQRRSDFVDSSGLRLSLTPKLRKYDAGTFVTGVALWKTHVIPPFTDTFRADGHCLSECLKQGLGNLSEIHVFATFLHGHLLTRAIKFRHFRNGVEQRPITVEEKYDFNFQETRQLESEVTVGPDDHLVAECYYNSTQRKTVTFGGLSTREEMCEAYSMYYPRMSLSNCYSSIDVKRLADFVNVSLFPSNLTIIKPERMRGRMLDDVIRTEVDWSNEDTRSRLMRETTSYDHPINPRCFGNNGDAFQWHLEAGSHDTNRRDFLWLTASGYRKVDKFAKGGSFLFGT